MTKARAEAFSDVVGFSTGLVLYSIATLVSALDARLGLAIFILVAMFYIALPLLRRPLESAAGER